MLEYARARLTVASAAALLATAVWLAPAQSLAEAVPEHYPPDYGGAFPLAVMTVPLGLGFYPLLVLPAIGFDGLDGATNLWNRLVWHPIQYFTRDRTGEPQY